MYFISTRSNNPQKFTSAHVIKQGIAADGGLFMPESIPALTFDEINKLITFDYPHRAAYVIGKFLTDYTESELESACVAAYGEPKFPANPVPLAKLNDNIYVMELWHGPTSAFKDMALQLMPRLLAKALDKEDEKRDALILVATSGDTGKAALEGYSDNERVKIHVFYPVDGVSDIQKKQMATTEGKNVRVTAVKGNFDDCQSGVKAIFADSSVAYELDGRGLFLSSANSINFGRLVPQIAYYVSAYCDLIKLGRISLGDKIDVTVPTGNFGNILACYIAKKMGLPIGVLCCASNKNRILTDFFETGVYDRRREFYTTASPSMDILISSNLERLLFMVAGADKTAEYMQNLKENGIFTVDNAVMDVIRRDFTAGSCDEKQTAETIRNCFDEYHYLCDTHTAVGLYTVLSQNKNGNTVTLAASTASPYKFASAVLKALSVTPPSDFEALRLLSKHTGTSAPANLMKLESAPVRFTEVIEVSGMKKCVLED